MAFPRDAIGPDEDVALHRHPHWKMLVLPALTALVVTALAGFLAGVAERATEGTARTAAVAAVGVAWAAIVVLRTVVPVMRWRSTHFVVTDRRVIVRQGVLAHHGTDIPLARIANVQFRHGLIDRLLRTGTLVVVAGSDDPLEFDDVPDVERVHSLLYHHVVTDADDRPDEGHEPRRVVR